MKLQLGVCEKADHCAKNQPRSTQVLELDLYKREEESGCRL